MPEVRRELKAALADLADFERRVVLMEPDRHRVREIAELFEKAGWAAEAHASYRLAGESEAAALLESRVDVALERREVAAREPVPVPAQGPFTLLEELTRAIGVGGDSAVAQTFSATLSRSLTGEGLPPESVIQCGAQVEATHGPIPELRVEIAAALLCLGEDAAAYQVLAREAARPEASTRAKKLFASVLEARGRLSEAIALYESIAAQNIDYPGVQAALTRISRARSAERRYEEGRELHRGLAGTIVSRARDRHLHREVVIKRRKRPEHTERALVERELQVCEQVSHSKLVTILDVDPKASALVYEPLEGDLASCPAAQIAARDARQWAQLCEAVAQMHAVGLVHGRLAPEHILFSVSRGLVLGGLAGASEALVCAPEDVFALGECIRRSASESLSTAQRALLEACRSQSPAFRPSAGALARAFQWC